MIVRRLASEPENSELLKVNSSSGKNISIEKLKTKFLKNFFLGARSLSQFSLLRTDHTFLQIRGLFTQNREKKKSQVLLCLQKIA